MIEIKNEFAESILTLISSEVWGLHNLIKSKEIITKHVLESQIDEYSKNIIHDVIEHIENKKDLDKYLANSILYYENLSINKPKKKKKESKNYFTKDTENAIVLYNNTENIEEKNIIYDNHIHYPFFKLTENIIHSFKFHYTGTSSIEDLQHEAIIFLISKLHRFNPDNGAKAYSYFGTIAKRYFIINNKKNYKKRIENIQTDEISKDISYSYVIDSNIPDNDKLNDFIDLYTEFCTKNIYIIFSKENDAKIADAILELFRKREHIDIFNKKALYIYVREMVDAKTPKITKIANQLYSIFKSSYIKYIDTGHISFNI